LNNNVILLIGTATQMAFIINLYITPLLIYISHKHSIFDIVDDRKVHSEDTSRLGGIGIYLSFIISTLISPIIVSVILKGTFPFKNSEIKLPFLILGTFVIFITGVLDDFTPIRARYKLVGQIVASILVIIGGAVISYVHIPFTESTINLGYFSYPITILWIIGITNSINLIDGIDGLSSGISIIAAMIFGVVFLLYGQFISAIICFSLVGSLFGYLFFNFPPARIFMGDSGSLFLGFILAVLPIATFPHSGTSLILPVTMLAIPIVDVFAAIWRRIRDKRNIFSPDKFHIHHKLLNLGINNRNILAIIYGMCLILGMVVIIYELNPEQNFTYVLLSWILVIGFFIYLHFNKGKE